LNGQGMEELALDLVAAVPARHRNRRMVHSALSDNAWLQCLLDDYEDTVAR
jgi:hypothetical protein